MRVVLVVVAVNGGTESSPISLKHHHLCSKDEQMSYGFETS